MVSETGTKPGRGRPLNEVKYKTKISKATDIMGRMLPEAAQAQQTIADALRKAFE